MTRAEALAIARKIQLGTATDEEVASTAELLADALTKAPGAVFTSDLN